jgi:TolA-binding protein
MRFSILCILLLSGCAIHSERGTIAELHQSRVDLSDLEIDDGLNQAIASYEQFLHGSTSLEGLTPEALRRLADLKVEQEYGQISSPAENRVSDPLPAPKKGATPEPKKIEATVSAATIIGGESEQQFERRTTSPSPMAAAESPDLAELPDDDLEKAGPLEAIALYQRLLREYPLYQHNDQVLYQMSRAFEELGRIDEAMKIMGQLVAEYPGSRYIDEVQFRRAENLFTRHRYLDAENAYSSIVNLGVSSDYYQLALYKLGWTFYKQELYEDALQRFIALLDYKVDIGYDFEVDAEPLEQKRIEDTFRVISLSFSYLGGAESTADYFSDYGHRTFESNIYENLAEYYFDKRRYNDASQTFAKFIELNSYHRKAPLFALRIIDINTAGGFPSLVIEAKKNFARDYGKQSEYWNYFEQGERPEIIAGLKANLTDLANHYHALYQSPKQKKEQPANFIEATLWYREFLTAFPTDATSAGMNYQLADLLLDNRSFLEAAVEYEKTAYQYERHDQSAKAGYAAVYAYRQHLETTTAAKTQVEALPDVMLDVIRISLLFAKTYPEHDKAAIVLGAAADDLYALKDYENALYAALDLTDNFPAAETAVTRAAWLVIGHSTYELGLYPGAEEAYLRVLELLPAAAQAEERDGLIDNLAAAIYRQGEEANSAEDYVAAAKHFLRVATLAPTSTIRSTAEYDAATAWIQAKDWTQAATVLNDFRANFPEHQLQPEVTKKLAYVYREGDLPVLAAQEFERIETESDDPAIRAESLLLAAELYQQEKLVEQTLKVYLRYIGYFPKPLDLYIETCQKIAIIYRDMERLDEYQVMLRQIIAIDAGAGPQRTDRTMFLAAKAGLVLIEHDYQQFAKIKLIKPFEKNLKKKQTAMKALIKGFTRLIDYQVGEVTAASTYYLAEIYADFSLSLMKSERPEGLDEIDLEDYEMALEDQAYPFEEKAIRVHQSNLELMDQGVYNNWIEKSLARLAVFLPARYAKEEEECPIVDELSGFIYAIALPAPKAVGTETGVRPTTEDAQGKAASPEVNEPRTGSALQEIEP